MGNLKDSTMEKLADKGNGNYAYIDSLHEARKVLVERGRRDAGHDRQGREDPGRVQPGARSAAYRLIGYENRVLRERGLQRRHARTPARSAPATRVTALYEIVPAGRARSSAPGVDPLKYQQRRRRRRRARRGDELMTVKLRYKAPDGDDQPADRGAGQRSRRASCRRISASPRRSPSSACCCGESEHRGRRRYAECARAGRRFRGADPDGYRAEFVRLVELAEAVALRTADAAVKGATTEARDKCLAA